MLLRFLSSFADDRDIQASANSGGYVSQRYAFFGNGVIPISGRSLFQGKPVKAAGVEHQVAQIMQARNAFGDSIVSSFDWDYLKKIQQLHFNIRVGLLAEEKPVDLMMNAVAMRAHSINPRWDMVTADLCKAAHERGLKVYTWTVDSDARMRALIECGVDGIMTNYPERLRTVQGG